MKILHLYHDLMNLYGDYANISALCRILKTNGTEYSLDKKSITDELSLLDYDFIFVGSGTEQNQRLAMRHLEAYKEDLKEYIQSGKFALFTGNSFEILGSKIQSFLGDIEGLQLFDFTVTEKAGIRKTADTIFTLEGLDTPLVGFINKCSEIEGIANSLFTVQRGLGNSKGENTEGILYNNFFGTHLTGPVLVKNPHFLKYIAEKLTGKELSIEAFAYEQKGFEITLKNLKQ